MTTIIGTLTDEDALDAISKVDEIDNSISAAFDTLTSDQKAAGSSQIAAWNSDRRNAYAAWADKAQKDLSGGFLAGQWFGVPDVYNHAITWGERLKLHAADASALGANGPTLPTLPERVKAIDVSPGIDTKILIGLGLVAAIVFARKL